MYLFDKILHVSTALIQPCQITTNLQESVKPWTHQPIPEVSEEEISETEPEPETVYLKNNNNNKKQKHE